MFGTKGTYAWALLAGVVVGQDGMCDSLLIASWRIRRKTTGVKENKTDREVLQAYLSAGFISGENFPSYAPGDWST
jgi:hypothetical protein